MLLTIHNVTRISLADSPEVNVMPLKYQILK